MGGGQRKERVRRGKRRECSGASPGTAAWRRGRDRGVGRKTVGSRPELVQPTLRRCRSRLPVRRTGGRAPRARLLAGHPEAPARLGRAGAFLLRGLAFGLRGAGGPPRRGGRGGAWRAGLAGVGHLELREGVAYGAGVAA